MNKAKIEHLLKRNIKNKITYSTALLIIFLMHGSFAGRVVSVAPPMMDIEAVNDSLRSIFGTTGDIRHIVSLPFESVSMPMDDILRTAYIMCDDISYAAHNDMSSITIGHHLPYIDVPQITLVASPDRLIKDTKEISGTSVVATRDNDIVLYSYEDISLYDPDRKVSFMQISDLKGVTVVSGPPVANICDMAYIDRQDIFSDHDMSFVNALHIDKDSDVIHDDIAFYTHSPLHRHHEVHTDADVQYLSSVISDSDIMSRLYSDVSFAEVYLGFDEIKMSHDDVLDDGIPITTVFDHIGINIVPREARDRTPFSESCVR